MKKFKVKFMRLIPNFKNKKKLMMIFMILFQAYKEPKKFIDLNMMKLTII